MIKLIINKGIVIKVLCIFIIASLFILIPSYAIDFVHVGRNTMIDSCIFFTIGRYWFESDTIPYVELWDLKGPAIFFINGCASLFSSSIKSVALIQILFMIVSLSVVYKFFELKYNHKQSMVLTLVSALCLALNYEGADCVEEFSLPLLIISYYYIYKWTLKYEHGIVEHDGKFAFFYGLTLGFSFMTRLTNALGVMGAVAFICIFLSYNKMWKNIFVNASYFLLGLSIITLPFVLYFWTHNALDEMWYGTVLYNIEYAKNSVGGKSLNAIFSIYVFGTALLLYGLFLIIVKRKFVVGGLWFASIVLMQYWLFGSNGYAHYGLLCFPALCVLVNEASNVVLKKYCQTIFFFILFAIFGGVVYGLRMQRFIKYASVPYDDGGCQTLIDCIPKSDYHTVVMYNCNIELYYYNNIKPDNPYFCLQDFEATRGVSLKKRVYNAFDKRNSKWILYCPWIQRSVITPILKAKYRPYKTVGKYTLYKHI